LNLDDVFASQTLIPHKAHKASRPVAAVLDFRAIVVVNRVRKIDVFSAVRRSTYRQNLVRPHAKVPIGQKLVLRHAQVQAPTGLVKHDKVIACALHFGEFDFHT
jgi:hypothetical protein